jgi:error-prone DNA polymerase
MYPKRVIIGDARLSGVQVLPVDVNASSGEWRTEKASADPAPDDRRPARWAIRFPRRRDDHRAAGDGEPPAIRCSLREVKGISDAEVERIVSDQPYTSLRDFWDRARVSRPVVERLALIGAFDSLYPSVDPAPDRYLPASGGAPAPTRRDLLARVGVLARQAASARQGTSLALDLFVGADTADGMADLVPAGELRELDLGERVEAELEILGFDVSQHVIDFYADLLAGLNVVRSADLDDCRNGETILVAGAKVATQTPAVRSGQRIIFASLDDAVGLVDLTFFESVQDRCAARVFGSWLLLVRGRVRRAGAGPMAVTVNATECWDIPALEEIRLAGGLAAVRAALATGRDLQAGPATADTQDLATPKNLITPGTADPGNADPSNADPSNAGTAGTSNAGNADTDSSRDRDNASARPLVFANGFALSPYAETGAPGGSIKSPPRTLWHASPGSTNTPK